MLTLERDLNDMREYYESGNTKEESWRESQLKGLRRFLMEKQDDIMSALMQDLGKHQLEAFRDEVYISSHIENQKKKNKRRTEQFLFINIR